MPTDLVERIRSVVERFLSAQHLSTGVLLVGVSGGQDSVCLLDALAVVAPRIGLRLAVQHVNHELRGVRSERDAAFTASLAARYDLPFSMVSVDIASYAASNRLGLEEAARVARYQAFAAEVYRSGAVGVATAHTRDDLAETLLINIIRGTSHHGLSSIQPAHTLRPLLLGPRHPVLASSGPVASPLRVFRPLLQIGRRETAEYCRALALSFRQDESNRDPSFLRNRVRNALIPLLRTYNPSVVESLARLASSNADDERELEALTERVWARAARVTPTEVAFEWESWSTESVSMQRRLLRRAARTLEVASPWSYRTLEAVRLLLAGRPTGRRSHLAGGVRLSTSRLGFSLSTPGRNLGAAPPTEPKEEHGGR